MYYSLYVTDVRNSNLSKTSFQCLFIYSKGGVILS